jgi:hypothetical protein
MTGDQNDILARLKSVLPPWFSDSTPILDGVLAGWATMWAFVYSLYAYAALQTRITTATDGWLDMIAGDFFGTNFQRRTGQSDASYRATVQSNIFRERSTRPGLIKVIKDITGIAPRLYEPRRALDCGAYSVLYGYGAAGAYSTAQTYAKSIIFITVKWPPAPLGTILTTADIYAAIESVRPAGTTIWVAISY